MVEQKKNVAEKTDTKAVWEKPTLTVLGGTESIKGGPGTDDEGFDSFTAS
ncbi:hypothetical protein GCM10023115_24100 [Pontixanthobacter gangjinensis]|uniref:Lasso RiPP family leader peptide-containing protein n=1 Tax=Pontixanthobacter gangjinensis TaxID=1028742 RepID=A0A6I4SSY7_9SPHN|nr:hypothetical protein [Pontixanthobacter gangjinensis]MXO57652.1 hypothetical protein [Pontixanthobacter gangjinensis]